MITRVRSRRLCVLLVSSLLPCSPAVAAERTSWDDPNVEGLWDFRTLTPFERPAAFADQAVLSKEQAQSVREETLRQLNVDNRADDSSVDIEAAYNNTWYDWGSELNADLRTSLIIDPPDGRLPALTAEARELMVVHNQRREPPVRDAFSFSADPTQFKPAGPEQLGLSERCLVGFNAGPPLMPSGYNNNLRIVQTPGYVVLVTEMIHNARIVPLDGRPFLPDGVELWSGDARGYWEGETLVVETRNFSARTPTFQLPANSVSDVGQTGAVGSARHLHLIERFTRTGASTLRYEYVIDEPRSFARPFQVAITMRLSDEKMFEYACHEGNYAMLGMLRGARRTESQEQASN